ncbi:YdeI/OmpD-associated family protein [Telluribacter sp.]|jgi:hypothetical protein|uniref:YdeI/OmpD-associated family protein n=1 Tax=Telluribacter sp. TaxID=1978767 RepID=UPI002E14BE10|nr:YdeI/OmpD-associated family protein [Telluribacter sp.]
MATIRPEAPQRIDAYIAEAAPFAQAILSRIRQLIHETIPDIKEDWKWGPNFHLNGMVCGLWAFKGHTSMNFYKGAAMSDRHGLFTHGLDNEKMRMIQYRDISEINEAQLIDYLKEAAQLNRDGVAIAPASRTLEVPDLLRQHLVQHDLIEAFDKLTYTQRKEYIQLITGAKREETRQRRLDKIVEMLREKVVG